MRAEGCYHHSREVLGDPWVTWEAMEEIEEVSLQEDPRVPERTPPEEETSSTELETGSVPIQVVETRTSPGEECNQCKVPKPEGFLLPPGEVALVACGEEEMAPWLMVVPVECSEVAVVETEVASIMARAWTEVILVEENEVALGGPLNL
ncbi:hypothetical protein AAY473_018044 [Plecturocebus cupreus]